MAHVPVYCATKAALHSFTLSLRHQLRSSKVEVIEIIPLQSTNLGGPHDLGEPFDEFADAVMTQLREGKKNVTYTRAELDQIFQEMNSRFS